MMGENPFLSDPNINKVRKALAALEFLAVQDIFLTETAEFADVVLPASSFFEKDGTYTNTDRRVQIGRPAIEPPGEARLDWQVLCDLSTPAGLPDGLRVAGGGVRRVVAADAELRGLSYDEPRRGRARSGRTPDPEHSRRHESSCSASGFRRRRGRAQVRAGRVAAARRSCRTRSTRWC